MYKFYSVSSLDVVDNIIGEKASIKMSSAFNLNDPFELKFNLIIDPLDDGHEKYYYKRNPGSTKEDFIDWQRQVANIGSGNDWYVEQLQRNEIAQSITLCSFSKSNNNNLMWSHYTNNHTGFCVEYSNELLTYLSTQDGFFVHDKVHYSNEPPIVKGLDNMELQVEKMMFNKQKEWSYEQEYRVVFISRNDTDFIPIDKKFIKSVYIGSRANKELDAKILGIGQTSGIDVYYGITLGRTYEVTFKKHKEGSGFARAFWR